MAPPLYRHSPSWYMAGLTQVATRFSATFSSSVATNLMLLPSFPCQDLLPDGKHLTPVAGLHYILHLFDQAEEAINLSGQTGDVQFMQVREQVRHHEDRVSYLESRHVQLNKTVDHKIAVDAEFDDSVLNRSEEDWFVIQGLPRLADMASRDWQNAARKQVADIVKLIVHCNKGRLDFEVLYVGNPRRYVTGPTLYNVRMDSVYSATRLREMFSSFIRHDRPLQRPPPLKGVSIRNKVTVKTKIRIAIMRQLGANWMAANPGSYINVKGHVSRPLLTTTPARSTNARTRTYNFIQAATTLQVNFSDENLIRIFQVVGDYHPGRLKALFIVLNDDDRDRCLELVKAHRAQQQNPGASSAPSRSSTSSGHVSGSGSGFDAQASLVESLRNPPLPPSEAATAVSASALSQSDQRPPDRSVTWRDKTGSRSRSRSRSRSKERTDSKSKRRRASSSSSIEDTSSKSRSRSKKKKQRRKKKKSRKARSSSESSSSGSSSSSSSSGSAHGSRHRSSESSKSAEDSTKTNDRHRDRSPAPARER